MRQHLLVGILAAALPAQASDLWSFAPLREVTPRATGEPAFDAHPIDRLVRARQQAAGITPNPVADRRTLLRRAAFALTGLPPEAAALQAFLADPAPDAFARAIDALLDSPHYGERQARHWLDLTRYSDSNGLDENLAFANAFRYRDWVVAAHNQDLPYARFGAMQIAGDLLVDDPTVGLDGHLATGFLALGPRMLAEQDKEKLVLDTVDEQLDLVGRTFLGLTLGCARCHDHKFDPVPTRDYYALAGIFRSTQSFRELGHVSQWFERELASDAAIADRQAKERALAAAEAELTRQQEAAAAAQRQALVADAGRYLLAGADLLAGGVCLEAEAAIDTSLHRDGERWGSADCVVLHTHQAGAQFATWRLLLPTTGTYRVALRYAAQESRPLRLQLDGQEVIARAAAATSGGWLPADQQWFAAGEFAATAGDHELRAEGLGPHFVHLDALLVLPTELPASAQGLLPPVVQQAAAAHAAPGGPLLALWAAYAPLTDAAFGPAVASAQGKGGLHAALLGGLPPASRRELAQRCQTLFVAAAAALDRRAKDAKGPLDEPLLEAARVALFGPRGLLAVPASTLQDWLPDGARTALRAATAARDTAKAAVPAKAPLAICVGDQTPRDLPVHIRGSHLTLGDRPVPRGGLSTLTAVPFPPVPADRSGRAELAAWLFDPRQALTWRVAVNRIWARAFGAGLSRSPSNFGRRGDQPIDPELLDWLAADFVAHGGSMKHLWRRILLSRTWQQTSDANPAAAAIDPENRLLWRQQRVRLEAEAVRDAVLATSGALDRTLGGTLLRTADRGYVTNDQSNNQADYGRPRRSLYLPVIRNAMYDLFAAFDYCDPSVHLEQRPSSAVAPQALLLLNAPFIHAEADRFADRCRAAGSRDAAIAAAFDLAFGRRPTTAEAATAAAYCATATAADPADDGLPGLCQALFASNEFVYVD